MRSVFLTSSPFGPLDNSWVVEGVEPKNDLIGQLKRRWRENSRCVLISAAPADSSFSEMLQWSTLGSLNRSGFTCACMDVWDDRTKDVSARALCAYDAVILGGGHVPTQNEFFGRIDLRGSIAQFDGLIIGISAGSMNASDVVYAQPELPGESMDPSYDRFLKGLGLLRENILPHYQMVKDSVLDGKRLFEDITYPDSFGRDFIALPDGSYLLLENGVKTVFGEAYRIANGKRELLCKEKETLTLY